MNIDKEKLVKNLIIFAILTVVCMAFLRMTGTADGIGTMIIGGLTFSITLYIPVRMYPRVRLIGSIVILLVETFLVILVSQLLGETLGAIAALILLLAAFVASLLFL